MTKSSADGAAKADLFQTFIEKHPLYKDTTLLDDLRSTEYARLDKTGQVYLDYTGGNLYAQCQLDAHHKLLRENVFGNPHSTNPTSNLATELVDGARQYVLDFFNANDEYHCIFTPNASGALKIVGECYPFSKDSHFLLSFDNHNSVNGIREFAKHSGASFSYTPLYIENLRMNEEVLRQQLQSHDDKPNKLFAFPAQSNVSGVKHPLKWIKYAKEKGWDVLLDAAAFVPSSPLNLSEASPDFACVSFYKIFGYPTGLGALFIRKDIFHKLRKPWFAGGTVRFVAISESLHSLENDYTRFEDGTVNYLDIPAVKIGLEHINRIGMDSIGKRVHCLTGWLIDQLQQLHHSNGKPIIQIFGPIENKERGGTVIMNFFDTEGKTYPFDYVEHQANQRNISIRTGCFCNPGIDEVNSCVTPQESLRYFHNMRDGGYKEVLEFMGKLRGAVRVSVGLASNFDDVTSFINFAKDFTDRSAEGIRFGTYMKH